MFTRTTGYLVGHHGYRLLVQNLLAIDDLPAHVRQKIVDRSFLYHLLREVMNLDRELAALQDMDLIREKQQQPELEYIFKVWLIS